MKLVSFAAANPAANDFLLVSQVAVTRQLYACRLVPIGFVHGAAARRQR